MEIKGSENDLREMNAMAGHRKAEDSYRVEAEPL
jgi:hypothetical protein